MKASDLTISVSLDLASVVAQLRALGEGLLATADRLENPRDPELERLLAEEEEIERRTRKRPAS